MKYNHEKYIKAHNSLIDLKKDLKRLNRIEKKAVLDEEDIKTYRKIIEDKIQIRENVLSIYEEAKEEEKNNEEV